MLPLPRPSRAPRGRLQLATGALAGVIAFASGCATAPRAAHSDAAAGTQQGTAGPQTYVPQGADGYHAPPGASASPITDRFALRASFELAAARTFLRLDPTGEPYGGTPLAGEHDLGLARTNPEGRLELMFRMRSRNRMRVDYLELNRAGDATPATPIIFGNAIFAPNQDLHTALDWKVMGFTYTYAFLQTDRFELGAGLGVHLLQASVNANAQTQLASYQTSSAGALPTVALDGAWRISRRFAFTGRAQYFGATIHGLTGSFADYHGDFQYRWRAPFAVGLGYSYTRMNVQAVTGGTLGRLALAVQGPEAFLRISF
ncbi:MAG TPA: hypothetical protein VMU67_12305 [Steroidobacteraceae bacterium]|nr:hypothetical protein [Steroidobacteraceae bacterium]